MSSAGGKTVVVGREERLEANSLAIRKGNSHVVEEDIGK